MKFTRRRILWIAIPAIVLPGVVGIALMPSSVEGVYNPFSSFGCTGDQFMEFKDGRIVTYVTCTNEGLSSCIYEKNASGDTFVKLPPDRSGGKPIMRAEPHLLGTRFYYLNEGKSEWFWKRFVTRKMKFQMAGSKILEVVQETHGTRITHYDYQFKVIDTSFRPMSGTIPGSWFSPSSPPAR